MSDFVDKEWVKERVSSVLQNYVDDDTKIKINDKSYYLPSWNDFSRFLGEWRDVKLPDLESHAGPESCDCDNFAREFKTFADWYARDKKKLDHEWCVGQVWGHFKWTDCEREYHVCNWVILDDEYFWWIEPQDPARIFSKPVDECDPDNPIKFIML